MQPSRIPEALITAYRATACTSRVNNADKVLKIDEPSKWLADLYELYAASAALFITADNPFSEPLSAEGNSAAHEQLRRHLLAETDKLFEGWGIGTDPDWPPERSFLALGISLETARTLGKQFHQNAVVWAGADAVPQLILLA